MTFENDEARRAYFLEKLKEKLKDPDFRKIEGFPIGSDDLLPLAPLRPSLTTPVLHLIRIKPTQSHQKFPLFGKEGLGEIFRTICLLNFYRCQGGLCKQRQ
jgi:hypothetical protein